MLIYLVLVMFITKFIWFFVFVEFMFVFGFVTFWYSFYLVKLQCGGMLALHLRKILVFVTHFSWAFSRWFAGVLSSFKYFNSLLLTFITGSRFDIPCSNLSCFMETSYLTFITIQLTVCYEMRDMGVGCEKSRNSWHTQFSKKKFVYFLLYFLCCSFAGIFRVRFSLTFFWYLLILVSLLNCV